MVPKVLSSRYIRLIKRETQNIVSAPDPESIKAIS